MDAKRANKKAFPPRPTGAFLHANFEILCAFAHAHIHTQTCKHTYGHAHRHGRDIQTPWQSSLAQRRNFMKVYLLYNKRKNFPVNSTLYEVHTPIHIRTLCAYRTNEWHLPQQSLCVFVTISYIVKYTFIREYVRRYVGMFIV